ncbi:hypothetical protein GFS31_05340 [Leptolyngbya sp. BL0902]|nr:hypothetical protein GFS31_05340 [Leptolyngbya sp. BL0902]
MWPLTRLGLGPLIGLRFPGSADGSVNVSAMTTMATQGRGHAGGTSWAGDIP